MGPRADKNLRNGFQKCETASFANVPESSMKVFVISFLEFLGLHCGIEL